MVTLFLYIVLTFKLFHSFYNHLMSPCNTCFAIFFYSHHIHMRVYSFAVCCNLYTLTPLYTNYEFGYVTHCIYNIYQLFLMQNVNNIYTHIHSFIYIFTHSFIQLYIHVRTLKHWSRFSWCSFMVWHDFTQNLLKYRSHNGKVTSFLSPHEWTMTKYCKLRTLAVKRQELAPCRLSASGNK